MLACTSRSRGCLTNTLAKVELAVVQFFVSSTSHVNVSTAGSIRKQVSAEPKVVAGPAVSDDGGEPGDGGEGSASVALVVRPEVVTLRSSYR